MHGTDKLGPIPVYDSRNLAAPVVTIPAREAKTRVVYSVGEAIILKGKSGHERD